ncbi:myosin heavy chain, striated muscle-like [Pseudophryne corroboree]|uniref:myosin heavy chain, striated muscle-like n=1 Tax=Pseudophryne corroboree TaxID=495146 RepID=UPI0030813967
MSLQDKERGSPGWSCSRTVLPDEETENLLREFAELKRRERKNDPEVQRVKNRYRLKSSIYPSPANILHTGRQLPRTPGPGVLPLLPSQKFEPRADGNDSLEDMFFSSKGIDNIVPSGRQLERTPVSTKPVPSYVLKEIQQHTEEGEPVTSTRIAKPTVNNAMCDASKCDETSNKIAGKSGLVPGDSDTVQGLENVSPGAGDATPEEVNVCSRQAPHSRRISQLPVQGLNRMRISGVLKKMPGYECRNEDLEFLKRMEQREKVKALKAELLCLRKDLAATNQDKELITAKRDKIEDDIQKMKRSLERTVQLGRAFLSRTRETSNAGDLSLEEVLKQLHSTAIHKLHQEERVQLVAAQKELARRQRDAASKPPLEDKTSLLASMVESYEQRIKEAQSRIQQLNEEVVAFKTQIEEVEKDKSNLEASVQQRRQQIAHCLNRSEENQVMSESEKEKMNRSLQRILHRKDIYLERERILRKLKRELK